MATIDIGKLTFTHKGDYSGSTAYVLNDVVYYNGSAYIAKTSTTGNLPTSTAHWNQFSAGSGGIWNSGLSLGSAGQVVQVNSGASALEFGTVSSDTVKLATGTFSTSSTVLNVDGYFDDSVYNCYKVMFSTQNTNHSGNTIRFRWRNSSSTQTGSNYYYAAEIAYQSSSANNDGQTGGWGDNHFPIGHFGNDNNERTTGELLLFHTTATAGYPQCQYKSYAKDGTSQFAMWTGGCMFNGSSTVDGFQIYTASGNFTQAGFWTLYGFKK